MKNMTLNKTKTAIAVALLASGVTVYAGPDQPTQAPNMSHGTDPTYNWTRGVASTRHNLTQSYLKPRNTQNQMDSYRNNYNDEVCVYCHTPHGANTTIAAPLWNRTIVSTTYNTYNSSTLTQKVSQPGPNSLSCLSCHDGTVAIDSIINMPGSGGYQESQMTSVDRGFLDTWRTNPNNAGIQMLYPVDKGHLSLGSEPGQSNGPWGCRDQCHNNSTPGGQATYGATNFDAFVIGTDLRNDHPVGIKYPSVGPGVDFNQYSGEFKNIAFFDENGDKSISKEEIRLYNTGDGYEVECASCHDPHGVPSAGENSKFIPTFLRKNNSGSAVCQTCHVK